MISNKPDIVEIISTHIELKKKGQNYVGLCPFHGEKTPSFTVSPKRQRFKCFGCGEGGDVITFIQKIHKCSFKESLEHLKITNNERNHQPAKKHTSKVYHRIDSNSLLRYFNDLSSPFHTFCKQHLGITDEHLKNWLVGTKHNLTVFGLKANETDSDFYHAHYISYQTNGKRYKNKLLWHKTEDKEHEKCLYGLSDVSPIAEATIIVEAPKSAVIASYYYGGFNWVSTVGSNTLAHPRYFEQLMEKLKGSGMKIYYLADADVPGKKNKCIEALIIAENKYNVEVIFTSPFDKYGKGYDIADVIIDGNAPDDLEELLKDNQYYFYPNESTIETTSNDDTPQFPTHIFPAQIEQYVKEAASSFPCPTDFIGGFVLSVLASAIGNTRMIQLKRGWVERATLYVAIVAPPSSKKSPALSKITKPIKDKQRKSQQDFIEELKNMEDSEAEKPTMKLYYTSDATIESLIFNLNCNPKGLLYIQDEMTGWLNAMNQYKSKGNDKQYWLSFWSGSDVTVTRKSLKTPLVVANPCVNLIGGIQPDCVSQLKGTAEDGFINRILFVYPTAIKNRWTERVVSNNAAKAYYNLYEQLSLLKYDEKSDLNYQPSYLELTPRAKKLFVDFINNSGEMVAKISNSMIKATWSKLEAYTARFALILQLASDPNSRVVEETTMKHAIELTAYFKAHIRKTYRLFASPANSELEKVVAKIRKRGGEISVRDICTYKLNGCKNKVSAMELIETLKKNDFGTTEERTPPNGGRKSIIFKLH